MSTYFINFWKEILVLIASQLRTRESKIRIPQEIEFSLIQEYLLLQ